MSFHFSRLANNPRLQKLHAELRRGPMTTRQIRDLCDSCSPATLVSELRHNGVPVKATYWCTTHAGMRVYRYSLEVL